MSEKSIPWEGAEVRGEWGEVRTAGGGRGEGEVSGAEEVRGAGEEG